jgi:hypothetical protein
VIIRNYLRTGLYNTVRLFDDAMSNLTEFLKLQVEFPEVKFEAYFANADGSIRKV